MIYEKVNYPCYLDYENKMIQLGETIMVILRDFKVEKKKFYFRLTLVLGTVIVLI